MAVTALPLEVIVHDTRVRGGRPIIAGTGLRVADLVAYYVYAGHTPEQLAVGFGLEMWQVYGALAYYHLHKAEIDAQMRADAQQAEDDMQHLAKQGRLIRLE